jgi:hypothetical protein
MGVLCKDRGCAGGRLPRTSILETVLQTGNWTPWRVPDWVRIGVGWRPEVRRRVVKYVPFRARDAASQKEISVSASDDRDAARRRRQQLIERLNAREAELSDSRGERPQLSEEELKAEIERQRTLNLMRANFPIV